MERMRRSQRVAAITKTLVGKPAKTIPLGHFSQSFGAAKSTVSEDLSLIKQVLESLGLGTVETFPGAIGGVRYMPQVPQDGTRQLVESLCSLLESPERILAGGFLYMADLIFDPSWAQDIGDIFATRFKNSRPDAVVTVETKGIPLALMTARSLGIPLVVVRRNHRVTEGSVLSINYVSGSSGRIQTMALPRRALKTGAKVLIVDDFMKGGGTAKGVADLMGEFGASVAGIGVLVQTFRPEQKMVSEFVSLAILEDINQTSRTVNIYPSSWV